MVPWSLSVPELIAGASWLPHVAGVVVKGTALLAALFLVSVALRRASAGTRHLVWSTGLAAVLILPLVALMPWRLEVLPGGVALPAGFTVEDARPAQPAEPVEPPMALAQTPAASGSVALGREVLAVASPLRGAEVETPPSGAAVSPAGREAATDGVAQARRTAASGVPGATPAAGVDTEPWWAVWPQALVALWAIVAVLLLARLGAGVIGVRRIARRAEALDSPEWMTPLWEAADRLELAQEPRLLRSADVALPFTFGLVRPTIVLPASADEWSEERRRAVLFHELGHVRRLDLVSQLVGRIACAVYWFNPLVWLAARRARAESERACDDLVLATGTRPSTYADHLLQIVTGAARTSAPAVAIPMAQRKEFEGRVLAILEADVRRNTPGRLQSLAVAGSVAVLALAVGAVAPERADARADARADGGPVAELDAVHAWPVAGGGQEPDPVEPPAPAPPENAAEPGPVPRVAAAAPEDRAGAAESAAAVDAPDAPDTPDTPDTPGETPAPSAAADTPVVRFWVGGDSAGYTYRYHDGEDRVEIVTNGPGVGVAERVAAAVVDGAIAGVTGAITGAVDGVVNGVVNGFRFRTGDPTPAPTPTPTPLGPGDWDGFAPAWTTHRTREADPEALAALIEALNDPDPEVRRVAAHALGETGDTLAVAPLSRALREDDDVEVRRMAAWGLGEIEHPAAVSALADVLQNDEDPEVRRMAVWALGTIEDRSAARALSAVLDDADPEMVEMAVWALGEIEDPAAAPALARALRHARAEVRRHAAWALAETDTAAAVEPLLAALREDEDPEVRAMAAWGLAEIGDARAFAGLTAALEDPSPEVRRRAAWALAEIGPESAPERLIQALRDEDVQVRRRTAWALGEIEDPAAAPALVSALEDEDREVRTTALWALGEIGGPAARDALLQAVKSEDPEIRKMAVRALAETY